MDVVEEGIKIIRVEDWRVTKCSNAGKNVLRVDMPEEEEEVYFSVIYNNLVLTYLW